MHKILALMIISITPLAHGMHSPDPAELISKITSISKHEEYGKESYEAVLGITGELGTLHAGRCYYSDFEGYTYCELAQIVSRRYVQTKFDRRLFRLIKQFFDYIPVNYTTQSNDRFNHHYQKIGSDFIYTSKTVATVISQEFLKRLYYKQ